MNVICLEDKAFYALIDAVVEHILENEKADSEKWIDDVEAAQKGQ